MIEEPSQTPIDRQWLLALPHFLGSFSIFSAYIGFLFPLFIWLAQRDEDDEVAAECRKALRFQGAYLVFYFVFSIAVQIVALVTAREVADVGSLATDVQVAKLNWMQPVAEFTKIFGHISIVVSLLVFGFSAVAGYKVLRGREAKYPFGIDLVAAFLRPRSQT